MERRRRTARPSNRIFIIWLLIALAAFAGVTGYLSYALQKESIVKRCESLMGDVYKAYYEKVYAFSDLYTPIYRDDEYEQALRAYFSRTGAANPQVREHGRLVRLLTQMCALDKDIQFIALYNPAAENNFLLETGNSQLTAIPHGLPCEELTDGERFRLLGRYLYRTADGGTPVPVFLIKGGAIKGDESGEVLIGYRCSLFDRLVKSGGSSEPVEILLENESGILYDSYGTHYEDGFSAQWIGAESATWKNPDGTRWFAGSKSNQGRVFTAAYLMPWWRLFWLANANTPFILGILASFAFFAMLIYFNTSRRIFRKVEAIREGLEVIGTNNLDYRLKTGSGADEFDEIAEYVNRMAGRLKTGVEKEYELRAKQTRSELNQLQARFDPHFLYNTLEVIRGSLFRNGDMENADYIEKLSRIFRSLTDAEPVVSILDEISFCSLYVSLLQLRYHDAVDIVYDIDPELQQCGILTHLIQPAIENYFMHAMNDAEEWHAMEVSCARDAEGIRFEIADHGLGLTQERLEELNEKLRNPENGGKGYGLMSIANRIRIFYGETYGIQLKANKPNGICVIIRIPEMSVEEHQVRLGIAE